MHARMRQREPRFMKAGIAVEQQIEVQRARRVAEGALAAMPLLDFQESSARGGRRVSSFATALMKSGC